MSLFIYLLALYVTFLKKAQGGLQENHLKAENKAAANFEF